MSLAPSLELQQQTSSRGYARVQQSQQRLKWVQLKEQINHHKEVFEAHDDSKTGFLTPEQFNRVCIVLGITIDEEQRKEIFADGKASFGELITICLASRQDPYLKMIDFDKLRETFNALDLNRDGVLDSMEFEVFRKSENILPPSARHVKFSDFVDYHVRASFSRMDRLPPEFFVDIEESPKRTTCCSCCAVL
eukprot:c3968_g1_i1.p1 GENE.c3968_g1_i1~~c3968_g1_i1.p1  ORF type:complete len:193 (+),score=55.15 c3968_g1_i1:83-661(+)